ncbi:MAG: hypothetical protein CVU11_12280 [Bacteroidetes bacterium HGW-Bacteroidetes-6]|jgi:hypothetical protein|nr:MAG: hypothetical protein CVU11_12280 [Bacteroidetes bacterium HGW-Bacteroidetes-6]
MKFIVLSIIIVLVVFNTKAQNYCLELDGVDDYILCDANPAANITDNTMSIEAWIYPTAFDDGVYRNSISGNDYWGNGISEGYVLRFGGPTGDLNFTFGYTPSAWYSVTATSALELNKWQHVAAVYDGSYVRIYVNGVEKTSQAVSYNIVSATQNLNIGRCPSDPTGRLLNGKIDELRIWDDARTIEEIQENMYLELNGNEQGLVAYYPFNETSGTTTPDASVNSGTGTLYNMNGTEWEPSPVLHGANNCLNFDGTDDYVSTQISREDLGSAYTIELWFRYSGQATDGYRAIIGSTDGANGTEFFIGKNSGNNDLGIQDGDYYSNAISGTDMFNGTWQHIAFSNDNGTGRVYLNGILQNTFTFSGTNPEEQILIGCESEGTGYFFKGDIDELRIWNDIRTENEIRQNMYRELPEPSTESNLVAYYKFDEESVTTLTDYKNGHTGTLTNMTGSEWQTSAAMFGSKNCLDFDGVNDCINIPTLNTAFTQGTISFWIKPKAIPTTHSRVLSDAWDDDEIYLVNGVGKIATWYMISGDELMSSNALPVNQWTHVAITMDNTSSKLFINGVLDDESGPSDTYILTDFRIGGFYGNFWEVVNGQLDEFCIWSVVLTEKEIREFMCNNLTGNENNLLAYYNFNNISGTVVQDFSGNGNDGALVNMDGNSDWVASSAFNTWLNTSTTDWTTASNWSLGNVPSASDNIGIYGYSGGKNAVISSVPTVKNMLISSTANPTLNSNINVNEHLILESDVDLNGNTVNLGSSAYLIEDAGLFYGASGKIATTRTLNGSVTPINENIGGMGAEIYCTANMGSTVIERHHAPIGSQTGPDGILRYYIINPTNNSGLNATLTFHYNDSELNGNTESALVLHKSTDAGFSWNEIGGIVNTTENTITYSNINGFSWWTAVQSGTLLPVELVNFSGQWIDKDVQLTWETASETNVAAFKVYRSNNNSDFTPFAFVPASGNSNSLSLYNTTDQNIYRDEVLYYYLNEVSFDGVETNCSPVICLKKASNNTQNTDVYPNPFDNYFTVKSQDTILFVKLLNYLGEEVELEIDETGNNWVLSPAKSIAPGIYYLEINLSGTVETKRILKN